MFMLQTTRNSHAFRLFFFFALFSFSQSESILRYGYKPGTAHKGLSRVHVRPPKSSQVKSRLERVESQVIDVLCGVTLGIRVSLSRNDSWNQTNLTDVRVQRSTSVPHLFFSVQRLTLQRLLLGHVVLRGEKLPVRHAARGPRGHDHVAVGEEDGVVRVLVLLGCEENRHVYDRDDLHKSE
jgi:hypothetical protein